jgi:hypothetical protein
VYGPAELETVATGALSRSVGTTVNVNFHAVVEMQVAGDTDTWAV